MENTKTFDDFFNDEKLTPEQRARMQLVRKLVHEIYPEVEERISYAMPAFYPKGAEKATQHLLSLRANKKKLGIYGTFGPDAEEKYSGILSKLKIETGKEILYVPYKLPEEQLKSLLELVIQYNLLRYTGKAL